MKCSVLYPLRPYVLIVTYVAVSVLYLVVCVHDHDEQHSELTRSPSANQYEHLCYFMAARSHFRWHAQVRMVSSPVALPLWALMSSCRPGRCVRPHRPGP